MNATSHSVHNLGQTLLHRTGATDGTLGERDKIVLGKHGFRASRQGSGRDAIRSIKHFFTGATGATKNAKAWRAAAEALDLNPKSARLKSYIEGGKELTMHRLQKVLVNPGKAKKFQEDFGMDTITDKVKSTLQNKFGETNPTELETYEGTLKPEKVNNGVYVKNSVGDGSFAEFHRMEYGMNPPDPRNEKVHLSVHPDDVGKAYDVLAPILNRPDCPIHRWKVVDINEARIEIIKLTDQLNTETDPAKRQELNRKLNDAERLHEGAHFTLYAMPGQDGPEVAAVLREMEDALQQAGIRTSDRPESDEPLPNMQYSSFRIGSRTYQPGEEGYEVALRSMGPSGVRGEPATKRVDPFDPDYAQFKATFTDNPFFQSLQ